METGKGCGLARKGHGNGLIVLKG